MHDIERVTGRKARVSRGNRLPVSDFFFFFFNLSLKWQGETNYKYQIFFSFSLQNKKEVSFKILC